MFTTYHNIRYMFTTYIMFNTMCVYNVRYVLLYYIYLIVIYCPIVYISHVVFATFLI